MANKPKTKEYPPYLAKHPVSPLHKRIFPFFKYLFIKPKFSKEALKPAEVLVNHNKTIANEEKQKIKFAEYIGCHCFIDLENGYLIVNPKGRANKLNNRNAAENGMLINETDNELIVSFDGGFNQFAYKKEYCKLLTDNP